MTNSSNNPKCIELQKLTTKRKNVTYLGDKTIYKNEYKNIKDYHNSVFECNYVSPYSKCAHNVDSDIMIMAQDWSSDEKLNKLTDEQIADTKKYGYLRTLPTNTTLIDLLKTHFFADFDKIYATNLFPFIKMGTMSSKIPQTDMIRAALDFGIPQIKIVKPKIVICLGLSTFHAIRKAENIKPCKNMPEAININSIFKIGESTIFCQAHTGKQGQNNRNRNKPERVSGDWKMMYKEYKLKN
jgi:restriction system protein